MTFIIEMSPVEIVGSWIGTTPVFEKYGISVASTEPIGNLLPEKELQPLVKELLDVVFEREVRIC